MSRLPEPRGARAPARSPGARGWSRLLAPLFAPVEVEPGVAERLREAHERGHVVHVVRSSRLVDPLFVLHVLERLGLPRPAWLHDHPLADRPPTAAALVETLRAGETALLFLKRPRTLLSPSSAYEEAHVEALVALQRELDRPILLVPETLLWTKGAGDLRRTIVDAVFGDREAPGRLREVAGFLWHRGSSRFHAGSAVDLSAVQEREAGHPARVVAKKVRWSILHHLAREEELRTGPVQRPAARTRQMVLHDPAVRRFLAAEGGDPAGVEALEVRADRILQQVAADVRYGWIRVLDALIDLIWARIYDGIVVDEAGLARVRSAARKGPVVLVPSHKSHVDYLVLSQVFFKDGMMPPHIAAGENLSFPPLGTIFRRAGAFFLRRSFKGDRLYAVVFSAYVRRLLKDGHAVEFFIEGGRSRTGKLLAPRMGMLTMCVDPVLDGALTDLQFIPVSIGYEKIIEAKSYAKELHGGEKRKEDVGALLSSTRILRSRYGRVYVDFAEPISLRVFAAARGFPIAARDRAAEEVDDGTEPLPERRQLITQLGHRIVNGIHEVTRVVPTAVASLVLLARSRRGLAEGELFRRADRVVSFLEQQGVRLSRLLAAPTRRKAIREALGRFATEGLLLMIPAPDGETIYQITDEGRLALDYYKNNILHFFVPSAIVAAAVLLGGGTAVAEQQVVQRARRLSHLLKHEVSFRVDRTFEDNFHDAAGLLIARRTLERRDDGPDGPVFSITANGKVEARELAGLLAVSFEVLRLVAEVLGELGGEATPEKRMLQLTLARAQRQLLEGRMARAEGATQSALQSALALLADDGVVARGPEVSLVDDEGRRALIDELTRTLRALDAED